ncbi:epimerase [Rhodobacterales bacterium HKCCE3408]|nr:epimerase [Rhodobacterales bacterium HKCCE3408]
MTQTALILGPTGRIGRHVGGAFEAAGWNVRRFRRGDDLTAAAQGADVIVYGWNPAYPDWAKTVPGLTAQVIAAAKSSGATVMIPGNVYVYGQDMPPVIGPGVPHRATNPLGRIRVEMEAAYRDSGVRTIVLRAGDFLDTEGSGNWFDSMIAKKAGKGVITYPGRTDIDHAWAWLPDLAQAFVGLAEARETLPRFAEFAFEGYTLSGEQLVATASRATGREMRLKRMNWLPLQLLSPFWAMGRGLLEMRYLWNRPHRLNGSALETVVPGLPHTPVETALAQAIGSVAPELDIHEYQAVA